MPNSSLHDAPIEGDIEFNRRRLLGGTALAALALSSGRHLRRARPTRTRTMASLPGASSTPA